MEIGTAFLNKAGAGGGLEKKDAAFRWSWGPWGLGGSGLRGFFLVRIGVGGLGVGSSVGGFLLGFINFQNINFTMGLVVFSRRLHRGVAGALEQANGGVYSVLDFRF